MRQSQMTVSLSLSLSYTICRIRRANLKEKTIVLNQMGFTVKLGLLNGISLQTEQTLIRSLETNKAMITRVLALKVYFDN